MIYEVCICFGRNTFWYTEVTNHDDHEDLIYKDMERVADRMGGELLYVNKKVPA